MNEILIGTATIVSLLLLGNITTMLMEIFCGDSSCESRGFVFRGVVGLAVLVCVAVPTGAILFVLYLIGWWVRFYYLHFPLIQKVLFQ